jgi:hypothetical protein
MCVANHSYLSQDLFPVEIAKGGRGLYYSASVLGFLSKSKLKTGEEDDMDLGASGISVLFKTQKNRLAKPKKIRFDISFIHGLNPYTGLDAFLRPEYFDKIGIAKGKMEIDKKTGEMHFTPGGNFWYVSHLGKSVPTKKLFTSEVFTMEVLKKMEPIVNDYFRYKSLDEIEEVNKQFDNIVDEAVALDAIVSRKLLYSIFLKDSPLHDGAVLVVKNRIRAAGCVLPLSYNPDLDPNLGTRHRAALGLSERCDAVVVVVSEETASVSIAREGHLYRNLDQPQLIEQLTRLLAESTGLVNDDGDDQL